MIFEIYIKTGKISHFSLQSFLLLKCRKKNYERMYVLSTFNISYLVTMELNVKLMWIARVTSTFYRHRKLIIVPEIVFSNEDVNANNPYSTFPWPFLLLIKGQVPQWGRQTFGWKLNIKACRLIPKIVWKIITFEMGE